MRVITTSNTTETQCELYRPAIQLKHNESYNDQQYNRNTMKVITTSNTTDTMRVHITSNTTETMRVHITSNTTETMRVHITSNTTEK